VKKRKERRKRKEKKEKSREKKKNRENEKKRQREDPYSLHLFSREFSLALLREEECPPSS